MEHSDKISNQKSALQLRILSSLAHLATQRPKSVLLGALVITITACLFLPWISVVTDRGALVSSDEPAQVRYREVSEMFGSISLAVIILEGQERENLREAARELARQLESDDQVRSVFYRLDMGFFHERALLYLNDQQLECVEFALGPDGLGGTPTDGEPGLVGLINGVVNKIETASPDTEIPEQCSGVDPLTLMTRLFSEVGLWVEDPSRDELTILEAGDLPEGGPSAGQYGVDDEGFLIESDSGQGEDRPHLVFMFVQPSSTSGNEEVARALINSLRQTARQVAGEHGVDVGVTGMPAIITDEMDAVRSDVKNTIVTAIVFVLLLFLITFRSLRSTALVALPLVLGLIWTAGFAAVVYENLTMVSVYFAAVLFGLGIAFGIHLLSRFDEGLRLGKEKKEAVHYAMLGSGPGIVTGGVTTAAAFLAVGFCEFQGFAQLGVVAGAGVICMLGASLTVMPATLLLWRGKPLKEPKTRAWLGTIGSILTKSAPVVVALAIMLSAGGAYLATTVDFDYDLYKLLPERVEALRYFRTLDERSEFSSDITISVAKSLDEAEELRVKFEKLPSISRAEAVTKYLPGSADSQKTRIARIRKMGLSSAEPLTRIRDQARAAISPDRQIKASAVAEALEELADTTEDAWFAAQQTGRSETKALKKLSNAVRKSFKSVEKAGKGAEKRLRDLELHMFKGVAEGTDVLLTNLKNPRKLGPQDLPPNIRERFVAPQKNGKVLYAVYSYPTGNVGNREFLDQLYEDVTEVDPDVTGFPITHYFHGELARRAFFQAALYAALVTLLLLAIDFRKLRDVILATTPLFIGATFMLGTMALLGWSYNFVNVVALPLVFGAGVDFGVHLVHRYRQEGNAIDALRTTGRPVILSATTTLVGMGGLAFAEHKGAASLGWMMVLGIGFCLLAAAIVLPATMALWTRFQSSEKGKK